MNESNDLPMAPAVADRPTLLARAARPAELLLGLAFIASALLKAVDVNSFIVAIGKYGVVDGTAVQTAAALGTLAAETALGTALVLGWRPRALTLGAAIALLLGFSGLIVYGWIAHGISDCGCMGRVKMGPGASLIKNVILLALALTASWGFRAGTAIGRGWTAKTLAILVCAAAVAGYSYTRIEPPSPRPFAAFVFDVDGQTIDLGKGEYFVAVLSSSCEHCMASVEKLNQLAELPNFPATVGLCEGEADSIKEFELITAPQFPIHPIDRPAFSSLIGDTPPRFILVRDGRSVEKWDAEVPSPKQVKEAFDKEAKATG